jgi:hypothetical protein
LQVQGRHHLILAATQRSHLERFAVGCSNNKILIRFITNYILWSGVLQ